MHKSLNNAHFGNILESYEEFVDPEQRESSEVDERKKKKGEGEAERIERINKRNWKKGMWWSSREGKTLNGERRKEEN